MTRNISLDLIIAAITLALLAAWLRRCPSLSAHGCGYPPTDVVLTRLTPCDVRLDDLQRECERAAGR